MVVSFTGTRNGMTIPQRKAVMTLMQQLKPSEAHHGDCLGSDENFHRICIALGVPRVLHPCDIEYQRANCDGAVKVHEPKPPLDRNKDLVHAGQALIATPRLMKSELRSGTWATIRYAHKVHGVRVYIVWPNGRIDV